MITVTVIIPKLDFVIKLKQITFVTVGGDELCELTNNYESSECKSKEKFSKANRKLLAAN
jgi:hypothetical protein